MRSTRPVRRRLVTRWAARGAIAAGLLVTLLTDAAAPADGPPCHTSRLPGEQFQLPTHSPNDLAIGDMDADDPIDAADLAMLLASWGSCPADCCAADLDDDGAIGPTDLAALPGAWSRRP